MQIETQTPDTRPGPYFVSAIDGTKKYIMAGPYAGHAAALADVDRARDIASNLEGRAHFMAWGTCRAEGSTDIGTLNKYKLI
jgi:hypothetical protein